MKKAAKAVCTLHVLMESEVARQIRQHCRSSMKTEVCGVLIGNDEGQTTTVEACIPGANAAQGGAHVTFTQDTWEHIYQVKDKKYPDARIVGWYHSHPGFGVFLSEHDLFIHKNFFSSPRQIAWVYDPHNDEEGCFGWLGDKIEKVDDVAFRFGQPCGESIVPSDDSDDPVVTVRRSADKKEDEGFWMPLLRDAAMAVAFLLIGGAATFFYIARQANLLPRTNRPMVVIVDHDDVFVIRPDVGDQIINAFKGKADAVTNPIPLPPAAAQQPGTAGSGQDKDNGRK